MGKPVRKSFIGSDLPLLAPFNNNKELRALRWRNTVENEHFHFFSLSYHYENIAESLI